MHENAEKQYKEYEEVNKSDINLEDVECYFRSSSVVAWPFSFFPIMAVMITTSLDGGIHGHGELEAHKIFSRSNVLDYMLLSK